jgi:hypothetical protein
LKSRKISISRIFIKSGEDGWIKDKLWNLQMRTSLNISAIFQCVCASRATPTTTRLNQPASAHSASACMWWWCNTWQGGSRTQQTRKNPILSAVNLSVGDAKNPGTLGKVAPSPIVYRKCVKSTEICNQVGRLRNLNVDATFDLCWRDHWIPDMENDRMPPQIWN